MSLTFETTDGRVLARCRTGRAPERHGVVALDRSGVVYRVVRLDADGEDSRAVVEVIDGVRSDAAAPVEVVESTDGVHLALHHLGGDGPALLVCHATGFHGLAYAPLGRVLAPHFDVWAVDLRGHGASTAPASGDFEWRGMAEDVRAAVDAIGTAPLTGVGHSMGGAAILLAELARPGSFEAAYLYEPIVYPTAELVGRGENPMSGPARNRRPVFPSKRAARERYASRPPLDELRPDALAAYVEHGFVETETGEVRLACDPEHEARTFEAEDKMTSERIGGLSLRLVVAAGVPEPGGGPAELAPSTAAAVEGARLVSHDDLGHFGPLEDPDRVAAEIVEAFG